MASSGKNKARNFFRKIADFGLILLGFATVFFATHKVGGNKPIGIFGVDEAHADIPVSCVSGSCTFGDSGGASGAGCGGGGCGGACGDGSAGADSGGDSGG